MTPEQLSGAGEDVMAAFAPYPEDIRFIMAVLGSVAGAFAISSGEPERAMKALNKVAQGIISGELLD